MYNALHYVSTLCCKNSSQMLVQLKVMKIIIVEIGNLDVSGKQTNCISGHKLIGIS